MEVTSSKSINFDEVDEEMTLLYLWRVDAMNNNFSPHIDNNTEFASFLTVGLGYRGNHRL